jgi:hypothetical protein
LDRWLQRTDQQRSVSLQRKRGEPKGPPRMQRFERVLGCYQLLPVQPPPLPEQERVVVPSVFLTIVNVLLDFEYAMTV